MVSKVMENSTSDQKLNLSEQFTNMGGFTLAFALRQEKPSLHEIIG